MTYYAILNIAPDADEATIRHAFRMLARQYHPDAGAGSSSEKFRELVEAYETLIDPLRRREYDLSVLSRTARRSAVPVEPITQPLWQRRRAATGFRRTRGPSSRSVRSPSPVSQFAGFQVSGSYFSRAEEVDRLFEDFFRAFEDAFFDLSSW
jgi:DnaJ-class molecular chaperone